jgi:hypothetical protein
MTSERVADLTIQELKDVIRQEIDKRLAAGPRRHDPRSVREVLDSIKKHRWTPPPGSPSTLELLREDREQ